MLDRLPSTHELRKATDYFASVQLFKQISQSRERFANKPNEKPYHQQLHDFEITAKRFSLHVVHNFAQLYVGRCN
jgi:hypothetical protein